MTLMYGYLIGHWVTLHGLIVMVGLAFYVTSSHTLHLRRHPSAAIAWIVALVLLPYVALPLYLMFGSRKVKNYRPSAKRYEFITNTFNPDSLMARTQHLAAIMGLPAASTYHNLNIHEDGTQALHELRSIIEDAKSTVDLCTFVFGKIG